MRRFLQQTTKLSANHKADAFPSAVYGLLTGNIQRHFLPELATIPQMVRRGYLFTNRICRYLKSEPAAA